MTDFKNILRRALKSTLNETLESKADKLIEKIQKMEMPDGNVRCPKYLTFFQNVSNFAT